MRFGTQDEARLVQMTARQLASSLVRQICDFQGITDEKLRWRIDQSLLHFHDSSSTEIAWNDVQAVAMYNAVTGENIPVPTMPSEGYNSHFHTSPFDGGYIPGIGPHDHRDNVTGQGFCFAVYHPGTMLPQQPWSI